MGSGRLVGIVLVPLVSLVLSGCVTSAPEPGLSDAEAAEIQDQLSDYYWETTGLPSDLRPPDPTSTAVAVDEWGSSIVSCMLDAGYTNYAAASDGGYTSSGSGEDQSEEQLALFVCNRSYEIVYDDFSGYLNHAQRDYLYDYYSHVLVPCLADHGIEIIDAPTRAGYHESLGGWNPYYSVPEDQYSRSRSELELRAECPFYPPDIPDPGYFG